MLLCCRCAPGGESSHLPPVRSEKGRPWASVVQGHWPAWRGCWLPTCPALLTAAEVQSSIRAYKTSRQISEALPSLSDEISDHPHLQRTIPNSRADPASDRCPEQPSALLTVAGPCSFARLVLPFSLPCCTTVEMGYVCTETCYL